MSTGITVRPAAPGDVKAIFDLLEPYAAEGIVLRRSEEDILFYIKNFRIALEGDKVLGCVAVRDFGNDLLEVRSLAIRPDLRGGGIGRKLVEKAISTLQSQRQNFRLFALTLRPGFFEKLNFRIVEKELFPEKIWHDCSHCPKQHCCDEFAVIYDGVGQ